MVEKRNRNPKVKPEMLGKINQEAVNKYGVTPAKQYKGIANDLVSQGKLEEIDDRTIKRFLETGRSDRSELIVEVLGLTPQEVFDYGDSKTSSIDWHPVCKQVLAEQQKQQRIRRKITERGFELNLFVPLGLVERKEQQRRTGEVSRDEIYQLEQEVITKEYEHKAFLQEVINYNSPNSKHIAITGEPGAGKSTLLDKIGSWIIENNRGIPICVALGSLQGKTLESYLSENWLEEALNYIDSEQGKDINAVRESLKELFRTQQVWLLLDGLDEMAVNISANAISTIREQLQGWVGKARVVLTSRLNVWDARVNNPLSNFDTYKTLDFTDEDVEKFIDGWFAEAEKDDPPKSPLIRGTLATQLKTKIKESRYQHLQKLVKNPLRLSLLCQTWYHQQGDLPETKAGLYERFVREFQEWKPELHPLTWTKKQQLNRALGELGKRGIDSEARFRIPESLAYEVMGEELFLLACNIGWLNLVDRDSKASEPVYAFYHPTFQEYFAATAIDDWDYFLPREHIDRPVLGKKYRIFESEWKEVILFWFGRENIDKKEKEKFIDALTDFKDGCGNWINIKGGDRGRGLYEYRAYFVVASVINEFNEFSKLKEVIKQLLEYDYYKYSSIFPKQIITSLININNSSYEILTIIEKTLVTIEAGNKIAIFALVQLINYTSDEDILLRAAQSLKSIDQKNELVALTLVKLINSTSNKFIIKSAVESLATTETGNKIAISALVQLINSTSDEDILLRAAQSLKSIDQKNELVALTLVKLINSTSDEDILFRAAQSFENIDKNCLNKILIIDKIRLVKLALPFSYFIDVIIKNIFQNYETKIEVSINFIYEINDEAIFRIAIYILEQFISNNQNIIIVALTNVINNTKDRNILIVAAERLGIISFNTDNYIAIDTLFSIFSDSKINEWTRRKALVSLSKINIQNPNYSEIIKEKINYYYNKNTYYNKYTHKLYLDLFDKNFTTNDNSFTNNITNSIVCILGDHSKNDFAFKDRQNFVKFVKLFALQIDENNLKEYLYSSSIMDLYSSSIMDRIKHLELDSIEFTSCPILEEINLNNQKEIFALVLLMVECKEKSFYTHTQFGKFSQIAHTWLNRIDCGNQAAITAFLRLARCNNSDVTREVINRLKQILTKPLMHTAIYSLKDCQQQEAVNILWHCAQNLSYPEFYEAWHNPPITTHPEVSETITISTTPTTSNLNLAQLPQLLHTTINQNPELKNQVQLICIDASNFINEERDNPALRIYTQMQEARCPKWDYGIPRDMSELHNYWRINIANWEQTTVLIFYEDPTVRQPQGFSDLFLDRLNTFGGAIGIISDRAKQNNLQYFSPTQPQLVENIIGWIRRIVLEQ